MRIPGHCFAGTKVTCGQPVALIPGAANPAQVAGDAEHQEERPLQAASQLLSAAGFEIHFSLWKGSSHFPPLPALLLLNSAINSASLILSPPKLFKPEVTGDRYLLFYLGLFRRQGLCSANPTGQLPFEYHLAKHPPQLSVLLHFVPEGFQLHLSPL